MVVKNNRTVETYKAISQIGLKTVNWISFSLRNLSDLSFKMPEIKQFIRKNKPCLFIWDPKDLGNPGIKKDFYFGLEDESPVMNWFDKNREDISKYQYLITSQISSSNMNNPKNGFVGTIFSDGKGRLFGETYHKPGIYNHRDLTRPKEDLSEYLIIFNTEDFELVSINPAKKGFLLTRAMINKLISLYGSHKGYFEFVCGSQCGVVDVYTTGYVPIQDSDFPDDLHLNLSLSAPSRVSKFSQQGL